MSGAPPGKAVIPRLSSELWGNALFGEELWSASELLGALVRAEDGLAARWPTGLRVVWSSVGLAVRFDCSDPDPWATLSGRDDPLWQEEVVEVFLQSGGDTPDRYFELEVNPLGALFDARVLNPVGDRRLAPLEVDPSWSCRGILWGAGRNAFDATWWVVLAIPWRGLDLDCAPERCRANFFRVERPRGPEAREAELTAWSPTLSTPADFHRPSRFGTLLLSP